MYFSLWSEVRVYAHGTVLLDCVLWPWGQDACSELFKCFDFLTFFLYKKAAHHKMRPNNSKHVFVDVPSPGWTGL